MGFILLFLSSFSKSMGWNFGSAEQNASHWQETKNMQLTKFFDLKPHFYGVVYASPGSWICLLDDISENSESTNYVFDIFLIPVVKGFSLFSSTLVTSSLFHWVSPLGLHATPPFLQSSKMVWGYGQLGLFCQDSRDQRPFRALPSQCDTEGRI